MSNNIMRLEQTDYNTLISVAGSIKYRNQDIRESQLFGSKSILENYKYKRFSRYYIIYLKDKPIVPIQIDRTGFISFFISSELNPINDGLVLVKTLKKLLQWWTDNYETTLFVKTANWYKEANKLNKIIGFKEVLISDEYSIWEYRNNRIVNIPNELRKI